MLILAHRGYHVELPENTLAAFEAAIRQGADGVETDVQVTREGTPILFHDRLIQGREVASLSHTELRALAGCEVPTLVEALEAWPDIFWNLEVKMPTDPRPILETLRCYRGRRELFISSFWHPLAVEFGRELKVECGLLVAHRPLTTSRLFSWAWPVRPAVVWNYEGADAELVNEARRGGASSYVYGVQTAGDHARASVWKVAGLITDHPGIAKHILIS